MGKISLSANVILIIIIIFILLVIFSFKGYTECECKVEFNEQTQAYWTVCPTTGGMFDFWKTVQEGWTGICHV